MRNIAQWILNLPRVAPFGSGISSGSSIQELAPPSHISYDHSAWAVIASSNSCCEALSASLGNDIVISPQDASYSARGSYFSLKNTELHPSCVVLPETAQQVSTAVHTLSLGGHAWSGQCQFGIRGGGHTPFKGAANIEGGILIDLARMPTVGLSKDHKTITVSPSETWDMVYEALDDHNLSTLGTKVAGVGVGGAATACGVSYFSPRFGYICDMVENFEVVLGTGDIVNANAKSNPDLWKALRGGGNNFGVVTAITLKTFPQGAFWGGQTFHTIGTRKAHFQAHADLASSHPYDPYAHYINTLVLSNITRSWFIGNSLQYTKSDPPQPSPEVFKPFLDIKQTPPFPGAPPNTLRIDNVTSYSREYAALATYPKRWMFAVISFAPDVDMMEEFYQMTDRAMRPFVELAGFQLSLNYQPVPSIMSERYGAVDSLGPIQTEGDIIFIHWALAVDDSEKESDGPIQAAVQKLFKAANAEAKKRGVFRNYLQPTYADSWQNPLLARSNGTVEDMLAASKKYDPLQIFQNQVPGGFKLPNK